MQNLGKGRAKSGYLKLNVKGMKWLWKIVNIILMKMLMMTVTIPRMPVSNVVDVSVTIKSHPRNDEALFVTCTLTCI